MSSRIGRKWTQKEIDVLKKMITEGYNAESIATRLERCKKGVSSKAYSMKLRFSKTKS